jgi:RNA recognition motif-containing protein
MKKYDKNHLNFVCLIILLLYITCGRVVRYFLIFFRGTLVSTKLFVGSLPWSIDDKTLQATFEAYGTVVSANVVKDRATGRSRGFGFVEMENSSDASKAISALNNSELSGRNIVVNEAKSKI